MVAARPSRGQPSSALGWSFAHVGSRAAAWIRDRSTSIALLPESAAALCAALLYLPTLGFGYVFDDLALLDASGFPVALGGAIPYRPLRYASHALDGLLGGSSAVAHAHNALLHGLVAALVAAIARRLGASPLAAFLGATLAACHPLAVEAVAYVSGRRDLLSVALGLVAVRLALGPHGAGDGAGEVRMRARFAAALAVVLAAVAAKEGGLLFLVPVTACFVAASAASAGTWPRRPRLAPVLVAAFATAATGAGMAFAYGAVGPLLPPFELAGLGLPGRTAAHYFSSLLAPLALAPDYPGLRLWVEAVREGDFASGVAWASATFALGILGVAACLGPLREGHGFVRVWGASFAIALATWGGLHEPGADRHAYLFLPVVGVASALVLTPLLLRRRAAFAAFAAVALLVAAEVSLSRDGMQAWRDERSLWTHAVAAAPRSARAHANLARVFAAEGRYGAATRHLNRSLELDDGFALTWMGRAAVRCARGRPVAARLDLVRAIERGADVAAVASIGRDCPLPEFQAARQASAAGTAVHVPSRAPTAPTAPMERPS